MDSCIFHIDVNSAFLSWSALEKLKKGDTLDLRTVPSIIGGDEKSRHGVVLAKSIPAKQYGIRTGEPVASALRKCPGLILEPPDHKRYRQYSRMLMDYLHTLTSDIEQVSIDECYLNFAPIANRFPSPVEAAADIRKYVRTEFGFTVNIGISSRKILAKMASDLQKPDRTHTLFPDEIPEKMWPLPVDDLFMVGRSSAARLHAMGIHTIGELAHTDRSLLAAAMKSHGLQIWEYANGIDPSVVNPNRHEAKGIGNSTTLAKDASTKEEIRRVLFSLAETVSARLRKAKKLAGTVTVEIKYSNFQAVSRQMQLLTPSASSQELAQAAALLADRLWNGDPVRLLGIRATKLLEETDPIQLSIFHLTQPAGADSRPQTASMDKLKKLDEALDRIRKRYGPDSVKRASCMSDPPKDPSGKNEKKNR